MVKKQQNVILQPITSISVNKHNIKGYMRQLPTMINKLFYNSNFSVHKHYILLKEHQNTVAKPFINIRFTACGKKQQNVILQPITSISVSNHSIKVNERLKNNKTLFSNLNN